MLQLTPGDTIILDDDTPATVENVLWQHTRNGESAVAVVMTFGEVIKTRVLQLETGVRLDQFKVDVDTEGHIDWVEAYGRAFFAKGVSMASDEIIAQIQERLKQQREMMRVMSTSAVQTPRTGGRQSETSRERQRERAKDKRKTDKEAIEFAVTEIMTEKNITREQAMEELSKLAGEP